MKLKTRKKYTIHIAQVKEETETYLQESTTRRIYNISKKNWLFFWLIISYTINIILGPQKPAMHFLYGFLIGLMLYHIIQQTIKEFT